MTQAAYALAPGRGQRLIGAAIALYIVLLVAVPLTALVHAGLSQGVGAFFEAIWHPIARSALWLSFWTALLISVINAFFGTACAWVLVRYRFTGRGTLSALVDLPFAIPTLVAGIMIAILYGPDAFLGKLFESHGMPIVFAKPGIVLALLFVTLPFVIRAVEPVLLEIDPTEEEAALVLGAGPWKAFATVYLPALAPAAISGAIRSLGRALGEFGAIAIVAGNIPMRTQAAPVYIFGEIESGAPHSAAALSVVLLLLAVSLHGLAVLLERKTGVRHG
jgi:sulfate/thiosulfate transport system permease protein